MTTESTHTESSTGGRDSESSGRCRNFLVSVTETPRVPYFLGG